MPEVPGWVQSLIFTVVGGGIGFLGSFLLPWLQRLWFKYEGVDAEFDKNDESIRVFLRFRLRGGWLSTRSVLENTYATITVIGDNGRIEHQAPTPWSSPSSGAAQTFIGLDMVFAFLLFKRPHYVFFVSAPRLSEESSGQSVLDYETCEDWKVEATIVSPYTRPCTIAKSLKHLLKEKKLPDADPDHLEVMDGIPDEGMLIRSEGPAICVYNGGKRQLIANPLVFNEGGARIQDVWKVSKRLWDSIPEGAVISIPEELKKISLWSSSTGG